jgi:hypothetical protein
MRPHWVCFLWIAQRHCCDISSYCTGLHMTISEPFTPRTPDPDKAPQPPSHHQPSADKPGKPILVPSKSKAAFQWPLDCMWYSVRVSGTTDSGDA